MQSAKPYAEKVYEYIKFLVEKKFENLNDESLLEYDRLHFRNILLQSVEDIMVKCVGAHRKTLGLKRPLGIAIDAWNEKDLTYFAVFAISNADPKSRFYIGTGVDKPNYHSDEAKCFLEHVLEKCNISLDDIEYFVNGNFWFTNMLSEDLKIPSITCRSQMLHSAVCKYLGLPAPPCDDEDDKREPASDQVERCRVLTILNAFCIDPEFTSQNAKLLEYMNFQNESPYASRWEKEFRLCCHFCTFKNDLIAISKQDTPCGRHVASIIPSVEDMEKIELLKEQLSNIHLVHQYLTSPQSAVSLAHVRILFDKLIHDFESNFTEDLSPKRSFCPKFEYAIEQILANGIPLNNQERKLVLHWEIPTFRPATLQLPNLENENMQDFCENIIHNSPKKKQQTCSIEYKDLSNLPITSNYLTHLVPFPKYNKNTPPNLSFEFYDAMYYFKFNASEFNVDFIQSIIDGEK